MRWPATESSESLNASNSWLSLFYPSDFVACGKPEFLFLWLAKCRSNANILLRCRYPTKVATIGDVHQRHIVMSQQISRFRTWIYLAQTQVTMMNSESFLKWKSLTVANSTKQPSAPGGENSQPRQVVFRLRAQLAVTHQSLPWSGQALLSARNSLASLVAHFSLGLWICRVNSTGDQRAVGSIKLHSSLSAPRKAPSLGSGLATCLVGCDPVNRVHWLSRAQI